MNRLARTLTAPLLAGALALGLAVAGTGTASAAICRTCPIADPGPAPAPAPVPTPPSTTPIAKSGSGGAGNSFVWQGLNAPTDRFLSVHAHTNPIDGHTAWWMDDTATLDRTTGLVQLTGTIEDDNWIGGYTGGVHVIGTDDFGNVLAQTSVNASGVVDDPAWGVCGEAELFCDSSRSLGAALPMTGDFKDVTHLVIVNWHDGKNRLSDDLNYIVGLMNTVKNGITAATEIAGAFSS